jgi:hypothetical protein
MMQNSGPTGSSRHGRREVGMRESDWEQLRPWLTAAAHKDRYAPVVEVALGERRRLLDAHSGAPKDDEVTRQI